MPIISIFLVFVLLFFVYMPLSAQHKTRYHYAFSAFSFVSICWVLSLYATFYIPNEAFALISMRFSFAFPLLMQGALLFFFYYFPEKIFIWKKWHQIFTIILFLLIFMLTAFTPWVEQSIEFYNGVPIKDVFGPGYFLYTLFSQLFFFALLFFVFRKMTYFSGINKKRFVLSVYGFFAFWILSLFARVVFPFFGIYIFSIHSGFFLFAFILPTFYAMQKYRFFQLSYWQTSVLRHLIFLSFVLFFSLFLFRYSFSYLSPSYALSCMIISAYIIAFSLNALLPIALPYDFVSFQSRLQKMQMEISGVSEYEDIITVLEKVFVEEFGFYQVELRLIREKKGEYSIPIYQKNKAITLLEKDKEPFLLLGLSDSGYDDLFEEGGEMILPLYSQDTCFGLLVILSGGGHGKMSLEEASAIEKIHDALSNAFMGVLIKRNFQQERGLMKKVIQEKTKKLKEQFDQMKALSQQQSDLMAVVSHEFRTPLSIALFQIQEILESFTFSKDVREEMSIVTDSLEDLRRLTQSLFQVQQFDMNKVKLSQKK